MPSRAPVVVFTYALSVVACLNLACVDVTPPWEKQAISGDSGTGGAVGSDGGPSIVQPGATDADARNAGGEAIGTGGVADGALGAGGSDGSLVIDGDSADFGGDRLPPQGSADVIAEGGRGGVGGGSANDDAPGTTDDVASTTAGEDATAETTDVMADAGGGERDAPDDGRPPVPDGRSRDVWVDATCATCSLGLSLVHRYSFGGTGTKVTDSVGNADGNVVNGQLSGSGTLTVAGAQYVELPSHLVSSLVDATLEVWVTWAGGSNNQRIFDFGSNSAIGGKLQATTTVILSPNSAPQGISPRLRASYSNQVSLSGTFVDAPGPLPTGTLNHIAVVFDGTRGQLSLYLNGALQGQASGLASLSLINDVNDWLGRSQYSDDPGFAGTYNELRIYASALTAEQVRISYAAGPNAPLGP